MMLTSPDNIASTEHRVRHVGGALFAECTKEQVPKALPASRFPQVVAGSQAGKDGRACGAKGTTQPKLREGQVAAAYLYRDARGVIW